VASGFAFFAFSIFMSLDFPIMRFLILTAGYGEGHNAAARGLAAACARLGVDAQIADIFSQSRAPFYEQSRRAYLSVIHRAPRLWQLAYWLIDRFPLVEFSLAAMGKMLRALAELLADRKPHAVISVYPLYGYFIGRLYPRGVDRPFAFHTVVTDSITINSVWHRCASDSFIVPNEASARALREAGVPSEKVRVLGFPVLPIFADPREPRPAPAPPRVLFVNNSGGDSAAAIVARLLRIEPLHFTVAAGRDQAMVERIGAIARAAGREIELHGWTERMPELVMSHHLLIGKAGGATVQEAIAARTPMLMTQVVPGQEEGNARLLIESGCGALCETPELLAAQVTALFAGAGAQWRQWDKNIACLSRPDAAREIVRTLSVESGCSGVEKARHDLC
jgi:processive 1,2-diacylglycerol beta-glucosyltransferase